MAFTTAIDLMVAASRERPYALARSTKRALLNFGERLGLDLDGNLTKMEILQRVETRLETMTPRDEDEFARTFGARPCGGA